MASLIPNSVGWKTSSPAATSAVADPWSIRPSPLFGAVYGSEIMKNAKTSTSGDRATLNQ